MVANATRGATLWRTGTVAEIIGDVPPKDVYYAAGECFEVCESVGITSFSCQVPQNQPDCLGSLYDPTASTCQMTSILYWHAVKNATIAPSVSANTKLEWWSRLC